jgi:hypothetical protein
MRVPMKKRRASLKKVPPSSPNSSLSLPRNGSLNTVTESSGEIGREVDDAMGGSANLAVVAGEILSRLRVGDQVRAETVSPWFSLLVY